MKILIICNYASGLYTFRGMLIQELVKKRNIVRAIIPEPEDEKEKRAEIQLKKLHCGLKRVKMERRGMNPVHDISLMKEYYKTIRKMNPDLVIKRNVLMLYFTIRSNRIFMVGWSAGS